MKSLTRIFLLCLAGMALSSILILLNAYLSLGMHLMTFNSYFAGTYFSVTLLLIGYFIILPFLKIFSYPVATIPVTDIKRSDSACIKRLAKYLHKSPVLQEHPEILKKLNGSEISSLRKSVAEAEEIIDAHVDKLMKSTAYNVGLLSAASFSGRLDSLIVLVNNIRLTHNIIFCYSKRPPLKTLLYAYTQAGAAALLAQGLEDLNPVEVLGGSLLGSMPYLGKAGDAALQFTINTLVTLRVGNTVKLACKTWSEQPDSIRATGRQQAKAMLPSILKQGGSQLTGWFKSKAAPEEKVTSATS